MSMQLVLDQVFLYNRKKTWLSNWSARYDEGQSIGVLGPADSGKRHLLLLLGGYLRPTEGEIFFYKNGAKNRVKAKHVGLSPIESFSPLFSYLHIDELIQQHAKFYRVSNRKNHVRKIMQDWDLTHVKDQRIKDVNRFIQVKTGIAMILVHRPSLVLLYNPDQGLTEIEWQYIWNCICRAQDQEPFILFLATVNHHIAKNCDLIFDLFSGAIR